MSISLVGDVLRAVIGDPTCKSVLFAIADYADAYGYCWPSLTTISADTELSRSTVVRSIATLIEMGFLRRERRQRADESYSSNAYFLNIDKIASCRRKRGGVNADHPSKHGPTEQSSVVAASVIDGPTVSSLEPSFNHQFETPEKNARSTSVAPSDGWPKDGFEQFWKIYPNKVGKPVAQKSFDKARRIVPWAEFWAGLMRYVNKTDDRAWCNPATWLNQHRWADKPAQTAPRGGGNGPRPTSNGFAASLVNSMKDASNDEGFRDD